MSKIETTVTNLKINRGSYQVIQDNIDLINENELIITEDKNIPIPTAADNGKVLKVSSGDYVLENIGGATLYKHSVQLNGTVSGQSANFFITFVSNISTSLENDLTAFSKITNVVNNGGYEGVIGTWETQTDSGTCIVYKMSNQLDAVSLDLDVLDSNLAVTTDTVISF